MRTVRVLVPLMTTSVLAVGLAGAASATSSLPAGSQPTCAAAMSTSSVQAAPASSTQTVVRDVRVGRNGGCDRVVFEFAGPMPGYTVRYVAGVSRDGSGAPLPLAGSAFLQVTLRPTSTVTHAPQASIRPGYTALREVAGAGDFEGVTSYGIGLSGRQPYRAFRLTAPNRLVLDFAAPASSTATAPTSSTPQVAAVPTGGVQTGGGSTAGTQHVGLLAAGGALALGGVTLLTRRRRLARQS